MNHIATLERNATDAAPTQRVSARAKDDATMLKAAANLTRDLNVPDARIYWADMLGSALLGYAALFAAMFVKSVPLAVAAGLIAVLALYRAGSFIHELTHIKKGAVRGFRFVWNVIVGVPLLVPSFMYEGVHNQHHAKRYYGTVDDPEYLPLALMKPWTVPLTHRQYFPREMEALLHYNGFTNIFFTADFTDEAADQHVDSLVVSCSAKS